ncbi:protein CIP2A-like [Corticium candelabrum]|uniref:protein CIP2A-like n=1 Tax=Corticium candelabrum TaxID=121492 RepID=UPI002E26D8DF|nr:protein CIP2A-like [Corticium candelabrum]
MMGEKELELETLLKPLITKLRSVSQKRSCEAPNEVPTDLQHALALISSRTDVIKTSKSIQCVVDLISELAVDALGDETKFLCLEFINNLVAMDTILVAQLENAMPALCLILEQHIESLDHPLVIPCLRLLQQVVYRANPLGRLVPHTKKFLAFLVEGIRCQSKDSPLIPYMLGCLSGLARHRVIQLWLKGEPKTNALYRVLISFLSHSNLSVIVYSLSALFCLCFDESLGERLFSRQNVHQTFQLMFGLLLKSPGYLVTEHTVDLFLDILRHDRIRQSLPLYPHLEQSLSTLICSINSSLDDQLAAKLLELFNQLLTIESICHLVVELVFSRCHEAYHAVLQWAAVGRSETSKLQLHSMKFLKHVAGEATTSRLAETHTSNMTSLLTAAVAMVTAGAEIGNLSEYDACVMSESLAVILVCCRDERLKERIVGSVTPAMCHAVYTTSLVHSQLERSRFSYSNVVVRCLHLMIQLTHPSMSATLNSALLESHLTSVLTQSLVSSDGDQVASVLQLLPTLLQTPHFQIAPFALKIVQTNAEKLVTPPSLPTQECSDALQYKSLQTTRPELQEIIDQMKERMDIRDAKASDIIDVYEHKLASAQTREHELQYLLEAKTLALNQADRVIDQYRARETSSETERHKITSLIQKSERGQEMLQQQLVESEKARGDTEREVESLTLKVESLEDVMKQHQQLLVAHDELQQKTESLQGTLTAKKEENQSLSDMLDTMRRHNESLKKQLDCMTSQMQQVEKQRQQLERVVSERDTSIVSLKHSLKEQEATNKQHKKERKKMDDELRGFQSEVDTLKAVRSRHEEMIQKLTETKMKQEAKIDEQKTELEKHADIVAMIHNMTSVKS